MPSDGDFQKGVAQDNAVILEVLSAVERDSSITQRSLSRELGIAPGNSQYPKLPSPHLVSLYKAANAFVYPSHVESFGIEIVKAMAAGLPVIVGDAPGCRDLVRGGLDGLLIDPRDPQSIADAMLSIIADESRRSELSRRASGRAADFSWDQVVDRYCSLYAELLTE